MPRNLHNSLDHVPTLKADFDDHEPINPLRTGKGKRQRCGNALLWLLVLLQSAAVGAGGWWGWQQIEQSNQQLADAQHNFSRINEQLGAKIQSIDGKLVSTASTVSSGSENLRQQISELSAHLDALQSELKKQQDSYKIQNARQDTLEQQFSQLASTSKAQVESLATLGQQLGTQSQQLGTQSDGLSALKTAREQTLAALQIIQQSQTELEKQLKKVAEEAAAVRSIREQLNSISSMATNLSSLQKQVEQSQSAITRLEREQLALKVEQENRAAKNNSSAEFDAFRAQTTRSLNSLQSQLQRLQNNP